MKKKAKKYLILKRGIDIFGSIVGIFVCLTLFWWWIFIVNLFISKGRPIFKQKRLGKNQKVFHILKFRSMKNDSDSYYPPSNMSEEKQYLMETKFGHFLRITQLDETLQLFNILIGNMSFVGPRPGLAFNEEDLVKERLKYSPNAYEVRPGLTGLAQISIIDVHNPFLKAKSDSEYVRNISFSLDFSIFIKTIFRFYKRK